MKLGLSATSASLYDGSGGRGSVAKLLMCRGAGDGVPRRSGSSASLGPPLCGARKATDRKMGVRVSPMRWITDSARAE